MHAYLKTTRFLRRLGRQVQQCHQSRLMSSNATGLSMVCENDIAVITMNNKDNRLNRGFFNTFHQLLDQVEGDESIKGIITTGEGKFYSNGLDTDWMATLSSQDLMDFMRSFQDMLKRLLISPVPTLATLNGHTFAGGALLAFAQDFRVMNAEKGWICFNEVHLNKTFYEFLSSFMSSKIGAGLNVNDALIYGRRFTADEALNNGMIHSKAAQADLLEHSVKLLRSYVGKDGLGRSALQSVKEHVYRNCLKMYDLHKNDLGFSKQFMTQSQLDDLKNLKL